ncbi:hypothetical protein BDW72DRAFT_176068 [Aspergillus terricola var. indicus]
MSPEILQGPFSHLRTRPRAATASARPAKKSPPSSRLSSQAMSPPAGSVSQGPDSGDHTRVGFHTRARATSGPLRQPKPLSPSEIHLILEQEQEAMVNRLSRELSLLRHQTSSVASTASSASTTLNEPLDALHKSAYIAGSTYPTASRRNRSSSSLSASYFPVVQGPRTSGRSRRPSAASPPSQSLISVSQPQERKHDVSTHVPHGSCLYTRRGSFSQQRIPSGPNIVHSDDITSRDIETLIHENDVLRQRIRALEHELSVQKKPTHHSRV